MSNNFLTAIAIMNKQKQYIVWAESAFHSTHSHICNSYKEALAVKKEMRRTLYGKYKFSIKQVNQ